jgi:hypothetical protein
MAAPAIFRRLRRWRSTAHRNLNQPARRSSRRLEAASKFKTE